MRRCSQSRTMLSARKWVRYSALSRPVTGVDRPRTALIEQQDAEVLQRAVQPRGAARGASRPRRRDRGRPAGTRATAGRGVRVGDLAREDGDLLAVRLGVVERDREPRARRRTGRGSRRTVQGPRTARSSARRRRSAGSGRTPRRASPRPSRRARRSRRGRRGSAPPSAAAGSAPRRASRGSRRAGRASPSRRRAVGDDMSCAPCVHRTGGFRVQVDDPAPVAAPGESALRIPRVPGATPGQCSDVPESPG